MPLVQLEKVPGKDTYYAVDRSAPPGERTFAQWNAYYAAQAPQTQADVAADTATARRTNRCPMCMSYLDPTPDPTTGDIDPCPGCGWFETRGPVPLQGMMAPDTLGRVTALRANQQGAVAEATPPPVRAVPLPTPPPRQTYPLQRATLDAVVTEQVRLGRRPAPDAPLRTMQAVPCARCGKTTCGCPPPVPDVLTACVERHTRELAQRDAALRAAYPALENW